MSYCELVIYYHMQLRLARLRQFNFANAVVKKKSKIL